MKNKKLVEIKKYVRAIVDTSNVYEEIKANMETVFTDITNHNDIRANEFNKKYDVITLANSKSRQQLIKTLSNGNKLIVDNVLYNNDPDDILVVFSVMEKWENSWLQNDIAIFTKWQTV